MPAALGPGDVGRVGVAHGRSRYLSHWVAQLDVWQARPSSVVPRRRPPVGRAAAADAIVGFAAVMADRRSCCPAAVASGLGRCCRRASNVTVKPRCPRAGLDARRAWCQVATGVLCPGCSSLRGWGGGEGAGRRIRGTVGVGLDGSSTRGGEAKTPRLAGDGRGGQGNGFGGTRRSTHGAGKPQLHQRQSVCHVRRCRGVTGTGGIVSRRLVMRPV